MTVLGIILAVLGVLAYLLSSVVVKERKEIGEDRLGRKQYEEPTHPILQAIATKRNGVIMIFFGLFFAVQSMFWFYAEQGLQYHILTPTGQKYVVSTTGVKFIVPFSKIQAWQKFIDVKTVSDGEPTEGIEGVIQGGIPIRFIDQVTGFVSISGRFQIPDDEASFLALVEEFRDQSNLVNNTLIPTVREQVINTGYMYSAQDYVSGSAADFRTTLDEQLKDGGYSVEKREMQDTTFLDVNIKQDGDRQIKDIRTTYEVIKRIGKDGKPIRVEHDINKNNIQVSQVIVDEVVLEQKFKERLEAQRDISAQKRIEIEKIETAKAAQQRIVAEGERDKAAERVTKEKEQVAALIAIETQKKQEVTKKELAEIALETEKLQAEALRVKKDAEAYANRKLVQAGLTPQELIQAEIQMNKDKWEQIGKLKLPESVITGAGGGRNGDQMGLLEALLGAEILKSKVKVSGK